MLDPIQLWVQDWAHGKSGIITQNYAKLATTTKVGLEKVRTAYKLRQGKILESNKLRLLVNLFAK
jgi:hypothetical protein